MTILTNNRSGESIDSPLTNQEAATKFAECFGSQQDHWLWFWIHKSVMGHKPPDAKSVKTIQFLGDNFLLAIGYGLKRPMIRCHYKDRRFKIYLSRQGTICLKSGWLEDAGGKDPTGREQYVGCFRNGSFLTAKDYNSGRVRDMLDIEKEFLSSLEENPTGFLAQCGRDMDRCCYCNLPLEDCRSKEVGYGPVCAKHWGLPWGKDKDYMESSPSFSKVYDDKLPLLTTWLRDDPKDHLRWSAFADWLQVKGLPRVECPDDKVIIPRN